MQNTPTPVGATNANPIATYGPFVLSLLSILVIAAAWLLARIDTTTALGVIGVILAGNGLVGATRWQAAPDLLDGLQGIISQLASHIQTLHAQQIAQQPTAVLPAVLQAPTPPQTPTPIRTSTPAPVPSQAFLSPANGFGVSGAPAQSQPSAPVSWQQPSPSRLGG